MLVLGDPGRCYVTAHVKDWVYYYCFYTSVARPVVGSIVVSISQSVHSHPPKGGRFSCIAAAGMLLIVAVTHRHASR